MALTFEGSPMNLAGSLPPDPSPAPPTDSDEWGRILPAGAAVPEWSGLEQQLSPAPRYTPEECAEAVDKERSRFADFGHLGSESAEQAAKLRQAATYLRDVGAERREMMEVLSPFAAIADRYNGALYDDLRPEDVSVMVDLTDLRAARALLRRLAEPAPTERTPDTASPV